MKETWKLINSIIGKGKRKSAEREFKNVNGIPVTNPY